jgi:hypothetical protein
MTAEERRQERLEKKKKRKEEFDAMYDVKTDGDDEFYQSWKSQLEEQAKVCCSFIFNDVTRLNLDGGGIRKINSAFSSKSDRTPIMGVLVGLPDFPPGTGEEGENFVHVYACIFKAYLFFIYLFI